jgi:hypothetical protein
MTLAKRHIQRLWYPEPGHGGDIATRSEHAISQAEFNRRIPNEFWREVVDRCAVEAPHTLLLAEAFWMMEGYFVRTLGMHRVYNSAFMNMLKNEENAKYRATIKNTLEFDPEVLKRFVNFMNNPDEATAVAQFGKGDKYFGICTLLVTMPGLPMFGHGQVEGFEEKYGMEYRRSYRDEKPDQYLVDRHEREIFPLMKKRHIFSGSSDFCLYDLVSTEGTISENVFAYSNRCGDERALVFYNNAYNRVFGWIHRGAVAIPQKDGTFRQDTLCQALSLHEEDRYFTLFREHCSGLWYIRSSKELGERGFFAALNGYETQVFMDIHEVADAPDAKPDSWAGRWARLNHALNGRGVRDTAEAILDIYLGELYALFKNIFANEYIEILSHFFMDQVQPDSTDEKKGREKKAHFIDFFQEPVIGFVNAASKILRGDSGGYEPFNTGEIVLTPVPVEEIWQGFASFIERLILLAEKPESKPLRERPWAVSLVLGYGVLSLLKPIIGKESSGALAAALADHWQLIRKLRECWELLDISSSEVQRMGDLVRSVLARTAPEKEPPGLKTSDAGTLAAALILGNYDTEDFQAALGINFFDDVTWFNKEAFEETVAWASIFLLCESSISGQTISAVAGSLLKAEKASGYRLDGLLGVLTGEKEETKQEN